MASPTRNTVYTSGDYVPPDPNPPSPPEPVALTHPGSSPPDSPPKSPGKTSDASGSPESLQRPSSPSLENKVELTRSWDLWNLGHRCVSAVRAILPGRDTRSDPGSLETPLLNPGDRRHSLPAQLPRKEDDQNGRASPDTQSSTEEDKTEVTLVKGSDPRKVHATNDEAPAQATIVPLEDDTDLLLKPDEKDHEPTVVQLEPDDKGHPSQGSENGVALASDDTLPPTKVEDHPDDDSVEELPMCSRAVARIKDCGSLALRVGSHKVTSAVGAAVSAGGIAWSAVTVYNTDELKEYQMAATMLAIYSFFLTFFMQGLWKAWKEDPNRGEVGKKIAHYGEVVWKNTSYERYFQTGAMAASVGVWAAPTDAFQLGVELRERIGNYIDGTGEEERAPVATILDLEKLKEGGTELAKLARANADLLGPLIIGLCSSHALCFEIPMNERTIDLLFLAAGTSVTITAGYVGRIAERALTYLRALKGEEAVVTRIVRNALDLFGEFSAGTSITFNAFAETNAHAITALSVYGFSVGVETEKAIGMHKLDEKERKEQLPTQAESSAATSTKEEPTALKGRCIVCITKKQENGVVKVTVGVGLLTLAALCQWVIPKNNPVMADTTIFAIPIPIGLATYHVVDQLKTRDVEYFSSFARFLINRASLLRSAPIDFFGSHAVAAGLAHRQDLYDGYAQALIVFCGMAYAEYLHRGTAWSAHNNLFVARIALNILGTNKFGSAN